MLALVFSSVALWSCGSDASDQEVAAIGRAVALEVDSVNGLPVGILDEYRCFVGEPCRPRPGHADASLVDASPVVAAFAEARGIPVVTYGTRPAPVCPWREGAGDETGLWAEFLSIPEILGDTARVDLASGCRAGGAAFEQIHRFVLERRDDGWIVVDRSMVSIT